MVELKSSRLQNFAVSTAEFHKEDFGGSHIYLELDIWPIRYEIEIRQLFSLKRVLDKKADNLCLLVYLEMLKFKDETN